MISGKFAPVLGASPAKALVSLAAAGITSRSVAAELGVHRTTVARWAKGSTPRTGNLAKLRDLVDYLLAEVLAGNTIADARQGSHLQRAKDALMSQEQRAELARLADSIRLSLRAANNPTRSITRAVDPFALAASPAADAIDAAFLVAA
jgi:transcriptional regulator with XRE-family HTH domain